MCTGATLPADFKSVYRLFLRATSSATLHSTRSTKLLRRHWKPFFQEAAITITKLQDPACAADHPRLQHRMRIWEQRADNTVSMLYNASVSRGLTSRLSRNICLLYDNLPSRYVPPWKPDLDPGSPQYQIPEGDGRNSTKAQMTRRREHIEEQKWNALGEVVRMAEGTARLSVGRFIKNLE
ncbi:hypothetical protein BDW22DRAFT_1328209 [Trametopsis cervina]|nr:hypothetical protein BDW22DRAFT_1328209 [Trametopsis cervina]